MPHDVFISYSSKDRVIADAIVSNFENNGIRCWYAPRNIDPGVDWGEAITKAIDACPVFLLIFSGNANASKHVLDELYYSLAEEKIVIPFRVENLDPSGAMRLHLSSLHWLDAHDPTWESHIDRLFEAASANLSKEISHAREKFEPQGKVKSSLGGKTRMPRILFGVFLAAIITLSIVFGLPWLKEINAAPGENDEASLQEPTTESPLTPEPTQEQATEMPAENTSVPTQRSTTIPATVTPAGPTSTPISVVPNTVSNILRNPTVEFHEPFNGYTGTVFSWENTDFMEINHGFLTLYGDRFADWGGSDPGFDYQTSLHEGEAVLISMKFNKYPDLVAVFDSGEWETEDFRRFGIDERLRPEMLNGTVGGYPNDQYEEGFRSSVDTWYHALIVIGFNEEFSFRIWEIDDPSRYNVYRATHDGTWGDRDWVLTFDVNFGEVVLDAFTHISFDGYAWGW